MAKTKNITTIGMLCALAYMVMFFIRIPIIPVVPFLNYEPKDIIITIGGLIYGPLTAFVISLVVSLIELVTISTTMWWGFLMNVLSTCAFACTAAFIYKRWRKLSGAAVGISCGVVLMVGVMLLWDYLIAPIYLGVPREFVAELLIPGFLPFNLIKGVANAVITLLLYKPVVSILRRSQLIAVSENKQGTKLNIGLLIVSAVILATCVLFVLALNKII